MTTRESPYRWVVVMVWSIADMWSYIVLESLGLLLPSIRAELGLSPVQEGWLGASAMIGNLALALPAGLLLSRYRPKAVTTISLLVGVVLILVQGWSPVFSALLLGRMLYGITVVSRQPARALLIKQWVPPREVAIVNALWGFIWGVVAVGLIATPLILRLLDDSWRDTVYLQAGISLAFAVLWLTLGRERITPEYVSELASQERSPIGSIIRYKELWLIAAGTMGVGITWSAFVTFWPSYMLDRFDFSLTMSATMLAISGVVSSVGGLGAAFLVSKAGKIKPMLFILGIGLAASSLAWLWTDSLAWLALFSIVNGLSWSYYPITLTIPFELSGIKPREVAVALAFTSTAMWIGSVVGPLLVGSIHEATGDQRLALMVTCIFPLALTGTGILLPRMWDVPVLQRSAAQ